MTLHQLHNREYQRSVNTVCDGISFKNMVWLISLNQTFVIVFRSLQELQGWSFTTSHNGLSFSPIIHRHRTCTPLNANMAGKVHITWHSGAFVQLLLYWKSNEYYIFLVRVCSLRYPARNAHAPYCRLWPARLYNISPHYLVKGTIFELQLLNTKCVFWVSVQLLTETFLILRRNERDMIKKMYIGLHVK